MTYIDQAFLQARLGLETLIALFDDVGDRGTGGVGNPVASSAAFVANVDAVIAGAESLTTAWFPAEYQGTLPFTGTIPGMVKELCFLYAKAEAWSRNPDYLNALKQPPNVKALRESADEMGQRLQMAILRMIDAPSPTPRNVGGAVLENGPRVWTSQPDGTVNAGDF